MSRFPISAFEGNVLYLRDGRACAVYRLPAFQYHFLAKGQKEGAVGVLEEVLFGLQGSGQILLLWEELFLDEGSYLKAASGGEMPPPPFDRELLNHARAARAAVARGARVRRRYLVVDLPRAGVGDLLSALRDAPLSAFLGSKAELPSVKVREACRAAEGELYQRLKRFNIERAAFSDLEFILRRCFDRVSVPGAGLLEAGAGVFVPGTEAAFSRGAVLEEGLRHVAVKGADGDHYQAFVTFVDFPKRLAADGYDLFSPGDLGFPFDAVLHFRVTPPYRAVGRVDTKRRMLAAQMGEAVQAGEMPEVTEEVALSDARILSAKLEAGQPLAELAVTLAVADRHLRSLRSKVASLCQHFTSGRFRAVCPTARQLDCFFSFLPGNPPATPLVPCDPGFVAALGPQFRDRLGDPKGFFLGWSGITPVFWKPGRPALELNRTNAVLVSGSLGGGKSHLTKLLAYFTLLAGGFVLAVDPKSEYHPLERLFPGAVRVLDMSPRGGQAFNPFALSPDERRAKTIVMDYLTLALNAGGNEVRRMAIATLVEEVFSLPPEQRSLRAFWERAYARLGPGQGEEFSQQEIAREMAYTCTLLNGLYQMDIGQLVFGEDSARIFEGGVRAVVVDMKELPRPRPGVGLEQCTESERQGLALLYLVAALGREAAFALPRGLPKMLIYDEAWSLLAVPQGQQLLDEVVRIGRSFNLIPVIIVQNMTDVRQAPSIYNNVSQVFCFRAPDEAEVEFNLKILGAGEGTVEVKDFAGLTPGTCLFRDAEDNVGWLQVDLQPSYLLQVFETRPQEEEGREKRCATGV